MFSVKVESIESKQGSVWTARGTKENGDSIVFAGDWRMMQTLEVLLDGGEDVSASVEDWQVVG